MSSGDQVFASFGDNLPGGILKQETFAAPAAQQTPISVELPRKVQLQACCVENYLDAIGFTSHVLAYWTQGWLGYLVSAS